MLMHTQKCRYRAVLHVGRPYYSHNNNNTRESLCGYFYYKNMWASAILIRRRCRRSTAIWTDVKVSRTEELIYRAMRKIYLRLAKSLRYYVYYSKICVARFVLNLTPTTVYCCTRLSVCGVNQSSSPMFSDIYIYGVIYYPSLSFFF